MKYLINKSLILAFLLFSLSASNAMMESPADEERESKSSVPRKEEGAAAPDPSIKKERPFVKLIKGICMPYNIKVFPFTRDWNLCLQRGEKKRFIYYYEFDINSSASSKVCKHKPSTADLLELEGLPHVPHAMFLSPKLAGYASEGGTFPEMHAYAAQFGYNVVVKPTEGSGGEQIYHTRTPRELEVYAGEICAQKGEVSLSPFYQINDEYRIIVLNNCPQLVYRKELPQVEGDGILPVKELVANFLARNTGPVTTLNCLEQSLLENCSILPFGQKLPLTWKHNLQQGASVDLKIKAELRDDLEKLAITVAKALNISFASVDIINTEEGLKVMEVNSGIMMKCFMRQFGEKGEQMAKRIYEKAICSMFDLSPFPDEQ